MDKEYPLQQLYIIKQKRLEEAERTLYEKKQELEKEQKALSKLEQERDTVKEHKQDKLRQFRTTLDEGTTSTKIEQMKNYLKVVEEQLKNKEHKVNEQKKRVSAAEHKVEEAKQEIFKKEKELEKMKMHKKEWEKEMKVQEIKEEEKHTDELGSSMHIRRHKRKRK
jgi:flagellar biosynthesis chaperone FliJ